MKDVTPELIRAITPIFMATVGAVIGVTVLVSSNTNDKSAGLGLASTAIAGAAGLAQTGKSETDFSVKKQGDNFQVKTPANQDSEK
ncbi:hypothetical protein HCG51_29530 [Tolypothrix sp. PCC 7910]|uniref:hypothetical protein n=1 Tax=Tolypothrix sp. PCC 7910 TaxID=2099387 RepID=UPI00142773EC|nr:hypothetical protein [Tolypothrix sp. PCC 7910]QIR40425.1 hypothetical protein HCG51_29530 [Tolypothrix sp. PCC 7910]